MLSINTNIASLIAQNSMKTSTDKLNQAIERMTTGLKINHASDNAANYSISTNMTTKINSYMVAEDNCAMGLDMITTAGESLGQIGSKLTRLRDLATQAGNGTYGATSLNAINSEANALVDEIQRLYSTAEYNGIKLFGGSETAQVSPANARVVGGSTKRFINDFEEADLTDAKALSTVVDETQNLASGKYTISSAEELEKLARLSNNGKLAAMDSDSNMVANGTYEFILTDDIDLKDYENWTPIGGEACDIDGDGSAEEHGMFHGTFNGNGHVIKNMTIKDKVYSDDTGENSFIGLFGLAYESEIKNLGVENVNIENSGAYAAGVISYGLTVIVDNCYTTGNINGFLASGIGCYMISSQIKNSYSIATISSVEIDGNYTVAGLSLYCADDEGDDSSGISNCFFAGEVLGDFDAANGKTVFPIAANGDIDCYAIDTWTSEENKNKFQQYCIDINSQAGIDAFMVTSKTKAELNEMFGIDIDAIKRGTSAGLSGSNYITLQVGIQSNEYSRIGLELGFTLGAVDDLRMIGLDTTTDYLTQLDNMLSTVNAKDVEYGTAQNRLESALDEISIQYENLVSSRSTIRDADIAEVSSHYIQQQILQQASATLMATANQSPAIALQLI